ncbi:MULTISPECIES: glycerol-3-phosphate dehydrogenase/oxidase [unclassified Sporosarcina]|uniref:glycerol-3-phosphate dehydrogenase/oxidase n=1 Tax=unclassified Sporosarcina TaxID=2647733 RepID=UPI000C16B215|nr:MULTISPECIES: glycerol-3-phosphate dehydrogenase/oxidase [unclassified Sporosarcina]PID04476.1 glycerol-3-phosphate dehydrogenase [Sporosarcina sp. P30]PID07659.1 glycerol-3-phosphate dehydrogenase [Sporosarcina sp. P31]PID10815.1 glycerol-3-phosphate dehydrogenase [Sporosarcina sp. P32b]
MTTFSSMNRNEIANTLRTENFDVLIIGGGITGAGIALDAAARGMKTALIEMQDFASGTSSRSTKLVHGGLRYLKQFEIKEVAELGKERAIVYENGPHVTTPEWMLLPFHKGGTFGPTTTALGLKVYDLLAGVKRSERRRMLNLEQTIQRAPLIKREGLQGSGYYVEYRTDDARLTIEVAKSAAEKGATLLNYAKAEGFIYNDHNLLSGVQVRDMITNEMMSVHATKVINAAGPWVDEVKEFDGHSNGKNLILSKGIHLVFDQSVFPLHQAIYFDTPDKRMIFAVPRDGKAYVGTTDTFFDGDPKEMQITEDDRTYILNAIHYMFPDVSVTEKDVESSWAGVRPLIHEDGKNPSEISRKDEIWESERGLITIAGGKLTGYRKMAETVVNKISTLLQQEKGLHFKRSTTKNMPISGGDVGGSAHYSRYFNQAVSRGMLLGFTERESRHLAALYGSNVDKVLTIPYDKSESMPRILYVKLRYAIEHEMTVKPTDFFIRRTGDLFFNIKNVQDAKEDVLVKMGQLLNWSAEEQKRYQLELEDELLKSTSVV